MHPENSINTAAKISYISLNDVADVVKAVFADSFVYRTSDPEKESVTVHSAIRQDEEFKSLFSSVLWDEFDITTASSSKLSTLFNRNISYVNRHGLVGAKKAYFKLVTPELFRLQMNHVERELIHLGARKKAHGVEFFNEKRRSEDPNHTLDYNVAKASIMEGLGRGLFALISEHENSRIAPVITALKECGYVCTVRVTDDGIVPVLSSLLLLSLNLFDESEEEYERLITRVANIVKEAENAPPRASSGLSKKEVSEILFDLSRLAGERLCEKGDISACELVNILSNLVKKV